MDGWMVERAFQGRKILLTLQMRNLGLREEKQLAQDHRNHTWPAHPDWHLQLSSLDTVNE